MWPPRPAGLTSDLALYAHLSALHLQWHAMRTLCRALKSRMWNLKNDLSCCYSSSVIVSGALCSRRPLAVIMGWVRCERGVAFGFQINYLCMTFAAGVTAWIKLSDTLHLTAGRRASRATSEGQTSPGRLWLTKEGEESLATTPSHMWPYHKHRSIPVSALKSGINCKGSFFSLIFTTPSHTGAMILPKESIFKKKSPRGHFLDSSKD